MIPIVIPSLRKRKEDIPYLVKYFIEGFSKAYRKEIKDITNLALDILMNYKWPSNVRELENVIEYAVVRTKDLQLITKESLPSSLVHNSMAKSIVQREFKKESAAEIVQLLEKHCWNKTKAAKELGIGRKTLWRMLKSLPEKE